MHLIEVDGTPGSWASHLRSFTLPQLAGQSPSGAWDTTGVRVPHPYAPLGWPIPRHPLHSSLTSLEEPQIHTHSRGGHRVRGQGNNFTIFMSSQQSRDLEPFFFTAWTTLNQLQGGRHRPHPQRKTPTGTAAQPATGPSPWPGSPSSLHLWLDSLNLLQGVASTGTPATPLPLAAKSGEFCQDCQRQRRAQLGQPWRQTWWTSGCTRPGTGPGSAISRPGQPPHGTPKCGPWCA